LILAVMILSFLAVLGAALLSSATIDIWIGDNFKTRMQALYLAEQGIERGREYLRTSAIPPPGIPIVSGGDATGSYSVLRRNSSVLTLVSTSTAGTSRRTIEAAVIKASFPSDPVDPRLQSVSGLERLAAGITENATDTYAGGTAIGNYGSPSRYGVAVVNGDCTFGPGTGYGMLLVRGQLTISGAFSWTGLIVVVGQGVVQWSTGAIGQIDGGLFAARTRDGLGNPLTVPGGTSYTENDAAAIAQANASFPYVPISILEY
jgi:hypothetical protein